MLKDKLLSFQISLFNDKHQLSFAGIF
ncbi:unnamed protein product [Acanthoscelides obtectus]|uniref:Uncharacterized protein n=1 Tax=Acanthoscelides obtectus TaxID=200917 RepID=A0A9P0LUG4_ACAOB|nr:unnamed protein product [Acanthoscelides obtectus]CAK1670442.1 hypothetical protein AOBTE_LOCUS27643 [Acanthoscelides obtectus]